jgi:hypothetical protein
VDHPAEGQGQMSGVEMGRQALALVEFLGGYFFFGGLGGH